MYAGKVVPKTLLQKQHSKEKMAQEIEIHRSLDHPHIVGFKSFFEDENFVFVILEMCSKKVTSSYSILTYLCILHCVKAWALE